MSVGKVLISGAGIGGLAAAAALGRRGVEVDVVEIKESSNVLGVGINQPGNSLRALDSLGVLEEVLAEGFSYPGNDYRDWQDNPIVEVPSSLGDERVPANCALTRVALHDILSRASHEVGARIRYGTTVESFEDHGQSVRVALSDGSTGDYDLLVGFEGLRSPLRRRIFGESHDPVFTGSSVWRLQLPRPESVTQCQLWQGDQTKGGVIPLSEDQMYMLLVTREPTNPRYERADYPELLQERLAGYSGLLGDIRERLTSDTTGIVYSPFYELNMPRPWHQGRVILLGDSVHTATPHLTQGAAMALEDAVVLAEEVTRDTDIEDSLTTVEELREPRASLVFHASHAILEGEKGITADSLPAAAAGMREQLPGQTGHVESVLNQPLRHTPEIR